MVIQRNNFKNIIEFYVYQNLNYRQILDKLQNKHNIKIRYKDIKFLYLLF